MKNYNFKNGNIIRDFLLSQNADKDQKIFIDNLNSGTDIGIRYNMRRTLH